MRVFLQGAKATGCSRVLDQIYRSFSRNLFTFNMILQAKVATVVDAVALELRRVESLAVPRRVTINAPGTRATYREDAPPPFQL